jgi:EAL domain-containing protein (putative c-di-GMP-specific phosphodiesterase class I)
VNVAPRQLAQPDFAASVARAIETTGANPRQLCLEITEAALIADVDAVGRELAKVRELGVRLAVDDFGTGYSSVGYVRQLPLDSVKIDKSFVHGLTAGAEDAAIAQAIIKMAHALGLSTVAEGVECAEELARLQQLGCDMVQGFYFAAPLTADAVDGLMHAGRELAIAS